MLRTRSDGQLQSTFLRVVDHIFYARQNRIGVDDRIRLGAVTGAQWSRLQLSKAGQMLRRVKVREAVAADGLLPLMKWKIVTVFAIHGSPDDLLRRLRIEDQAVEIENQSFDHRVVLL